MVGYAHVVLHLTLCRAAANLPASATIPINIHMQDATGRQNIDKSFTVERGEATQRTVEFDALRGVFRVIITDPKQRCSAIDYWTFISEQDRTMSETLVDGVAPEPHPVLFSGVAEQSFLYLNPNWVLLDKSVDCNKPAGDPLPISAVVEYDPSSFYVTIAQTPLLEGPGRAVLALQVATPTGEYHYIRVKTPFLTQWRGFPNVFTMNLEDNTVDWLATQPTDVLLCPKLYVTSVG